MTEQLVYKIYKITNSIDKKLYIGSTRLNPIRKRMEGHRSEVGKGNLKPLSCHMRNLGIDKFTIIVLREITVSSRKEARIEEQKEIEKYSKEILLNATRAFSHNHDKTRDQDKKRANRRAFYHRHKQNPEWLEKLREKGRLRMRKQRANLKLLRELPFYKT